MTTFKAFVVDIRQFSIFDDSASTIREAVVREYKKIAPRGFQDADSIATNRNWSFFVRGTNPRGMARRFNCHWNADAGVVELIDGDPSCELMLAYLMLAEHWFGNVTLSVDKPMQDLDLARVALRIAQGIAPEMSMPKWVKYRAFQDWTINPPATLDFRA